MRPHFLVMFTIATVTWACGDTDGTDTDKGEEEQALTDGKSDSFFKPTQHGPLRFDTRNPAVIEDEARFHSWTFELSDEATVELRTEISQNLDTVMYLYHREPGETTWGRFRRKNDDFDGNLWSQITHEAEAGEYRVIVKPFKKALSGRFSLIATCEGDGCERPDGGDFCSADEFADLPSATPYTAQCAGDVLTVLNSEVEFASRGSIELPLKCDLRAIERTSVDFFHEWWDDIAGFDAIFPSHPDEPLTLFFNTRAHDQGTTVSVDAGGDEDGITFIFDADDELVALYQHNQSPTVDYFCGSVDEPPIEAPGEFCFNELMFALPHGDEVAGDEGTVLIETAGEIHESLDAAGRRFAADHELLLDAEVDFELLHWESMDRDNAAEVKLTHADAGTATYYLVEDFSGDWLVRMRADDDGATFVCGE